MISVLNLLHAFGSDCGFIEIIQCDFLPTLFRCFKTRAALFRWGMNEAAMYLPDNQIKKLWHINRIIRFHKSNFMAVQPGNVGHIKGVKNFEQNFKIIQFNRLNLQAVSPFCNTTDHYFAIMFYRYENAENSCSDPMNNDNSGHLLFKSPGQSDAIIKQRNTASGFCIHFTEDFLLNNRQLLSIVTGFPFFEIGLLKNKPLVINTAESEMVGSLYKRVYDEYTHKCNETSPEIINAYLQALFLTIKRIYEAYSGIIEQETVNVKRQPSDVVRKFKSLVWLDTVHITENGITRKTVHAYAALLFIHPNYLNALVKKETGKTAREYIDEQLFNCAKRLLLTEELLVKEIAWQLSFNETAHFNNFFKRHAGVSPSVYRKQYFMTAA